MGYRLGATTAKARAKDLYDHKQADSGNAGKEAVRPHLDELQREGESYWHDRDVTAEDFRWTFGFRGVEFGNWAANDERQKHLNHAYDGLMDLAKILDLPLTAISLNGTLGIAFGARGSASASAHYEPSKLVINITKINGPGAVAHEWGHALDHYFGEVDKPNAYQGAPKGISGWRGSPVGMRREHLRPEMARAFNDVMDALFHRHKTQAEHVRDWELRLEAVQAAIAKAEPRAASNAEWKKYLLRLKDDAVRMGRTLTELQGEPKPPGGYGKVETSYFKQTSKLSGKSGDYWKRPTEMFARAFESYVFDKLGRPSQYLVHGVEPTRYAEGYKGNPYPQGAERTAINAAFDTLFAAMESKDTDQGVALFEPESGYSGPRRYGIPSEADPPIASYRKNDLVKTHKDYASAKAGDTEAAIRLVRVTVRPDTLTEAARRFPDAIFSSAMAEEASGANAIPHALAMHYASAASGRFDNRIRQLNKAYHTGADAMERMIARPLFDGPVEAGGRYVLVDDVTTMGSTLAAMADHIQRHGGQVVGVVTLTNAIRGEKLVPLPARTHFLERRFGDAIRELFGIEPSALTAPEAGYLGNFRDADALRARALAAQTRRHERLARKGLSERDDSRLAEPALSYAVREVSILARPFERALRRLPIPPEPPRSGFNPRPPF